MSGADSLGGSRAGRAGILVVLAGLLAGCSGTSTPLPEVPEIRSEPLLPKDGGDSGLGVGTSFEALSPGRTGIDFRHRWMLPEDFDKDFETAMLWGGVCVGDYDGDGWPDLFLTRQHGGSRLYRNRGSFRFEDVTQAAGVAAEDVWAAGATFADLDGDGDLDLFLCLYDAPNHVYLNDGDGTFTECAEDLGLAFRGASVMMAFADCDLDGDLDGYLLTHRWAARDPGDYELVERDGKYVVPDEVSEFVAVLTRPNGKQFVTRDIGQRDRYYRNEGLDPATGKPRFVEMAAEVGFAGNDMGLSATFWDYDHDGDPDLYVANDFVGTDHLYRNQGGTFRDVSVMALPHTPWFSMGSDTGDINNDGLLDLMASDMSGTNHYEQKMGMGNMSQVGWMLTYFVPPQYMRNAVYLNSGTERFLEIAHMADLDSTDWTWSVKFADLDNDGREDVYISNGMTRDFSNSDLDMEVEALGGKATPEGRRFWREKPKKSSHNLAYRNLGDLRFEEKGKEWGLDHFGVSFGAGMADFDRDGDLDLVVNSFEEPILVYRNRSTEGNRVLVRLEGTHGNRQGIGALVKVETGDEIQVRYLTLARGFLSTNEPIAHFGLGDRTRIDRLEVRWPSGHVQSFTGLEPGRLYTVREPEGAPPRREAEAVEPTLFTPSARTPEVRHQERRYDDYKVQFLLPQQLSRLGPGLAVGDVDGDGHEDVYVGGAAGQAGSLCLRRGDGWERQVVSAFQNDVECEDMGAVFLDADADGDLDLYVVSGGVEEKPGAEVFRDRLYLNDGQGGLTRAESGALPDLRDSGSCVAAADFDQDGDLDLFVGSRSVPGEYPVTPMSRLLRNVGGRFTDVTGEVAPGLGSTGLVTGAIWSDADGDGRVDLLVTHEWGPVKLYLSRGDKLEDRTFDAGLEDLSGWWNGIAAGDLDSDGDMDYVVTNAGLNSKYGQPSHKKPARLFYGDMGDGTRQLVEAKVDGENLLPVRGRSCSSNAMPFLREKFPTFHEFASSDLAGIYTPGCLDQAVSVMATELRSGILVNEGSARFSFRPLDRIAQISPGYGVAVVEANGDGIPDVYLVQNYHSREPETGHMDGGVSLLLLGRGGAGGPTFEAVWPHRSGLVVGGDAMALATLDLDGNGRLDFLVSVNDGRLEGFESRVSSGRTLAVRLRDFPGNPTSVGSLVTLHLEDGSMRIGEVSAGGSYLSQSSPLLSFGLGEKGVAREVEVRWPDGAVTRTPVAGGATLVTVDRTATDSFVGSRSLRFGGTGR